MITRFILFAFAMLFVSADTITARGTSEGRLNMPGDMGHRQLRHVLSGQAAAGQHASGSEATAVLAPAKAMRTAAKAAPAGRIQWYTTSWMCIFNGFVVDDSGVASKVCFGDDGDVWFYDISGNERDYWTKATKDADGNISIPLHQEAGYDENNGQITLELIHFEQKDGMLGPVIDNDAEVYTMRLGADGNIVSADIDLDWMERGYLALCDGTGYVYSLCGAFLMTPVNDEVVTPPADATVKSYSYVFNNDGNWYGTITEAAFSGNDVYVKGLCDALPDIWLKGEKSADGTQIVFRSGQYMGAGKYHHYFTAAHYETETVDGVEQGAWKHDSEYVCSLSADGKTITLDTERKFTVLIGGDVAYIIEGGHLTEYTEQMVTPAAPVISGVDDIEGECVMFTLPLWDVNGGLIDADKLSWRMYIDDQLYTFHPSVYKNFTSPTTEIKYGYDDGWDIFFYGGEQRVYLYSQYQTIGVESVYTLNGEQAVSARSYYGTSTGIGAAGADGQPQKVTFTDMHGRTVKQPAGGIYIRTATWADGTVRRTKVLMK